LVNLFASQTFSSTPLNQLGGGVYFLGEWASGSAGQPATQPGDDGDGGPTTQATPEQFGQWMLDSTHGDSNPVGQFYGGYWSQIQDAVTVSDVSEASYAAAFDWAGMRDNMPTSMPGTNLKPQDYFGSLCSGIAHGLWQFRGIMEQSGLRQLVGFLWLAYCVREAIRWIVGVVEDLADA
jgi:hypothetical protein